MLMKEMKIYTSTISRNVLKFINEKSLQKEDILTLLYNDAEKQYVLFYYT